MTPAGIIAAAGQALPAGTRCQPGPGGVILDVAPQDWLTALTFARDTAGCDFFDWLTAIDELERGFSVVAHLYSIEEKCHITVRALVPRKTPTISSAATVFRGAAWAERETHEMFGILFEGHPGLTPLLLPDGFSGYPLRKNYLLAARTEKEWPGVKEPGEREPSGRTRRRLQPPGTPEDWNLDE